MLKKTLCLLALCNLCSAGSYMSSARYTQLQEAIAKAKAQPGAKNWSGAAKIITSAYKGVSYQELITRLDGLNLDNKEKAGLLGALLSQAEFDDADKKASRGLELDVGHLPKNHKDKKAAVEAFVTEHHDKDQQVVLCALQQSEQFDFEKGELVLALVSRARD